MTAPEPTYRRSPWAAFLTQVERDIKGLATAAESARLREPENLVSWAQALVAVQKDVEGVIAEQKARFRMNPGRLAHPRSPEHRAYLVEKRTHDERLARRIRFLRSVEQCRDEARALLDRAGLDGHVTAGELLETLLRVEELLSRDDIEAALRLTRSTVDYAREADLGVPTY